MKELKKLVLSSIALSKQEVEQLKGGSYAEDVKNDNIVAMCICNFNNARTISNANSAGGCICRCV